MSPLLAAVTQQRVSKRNGGYFYPLLGPSGGGSTVPPTNVGVAQGTWSLYADCYADSQTQLDVEVAVRSRESQKTRFPQQGLNGADRLRHFDFHSSSDLETNLSSSDLPGGRGSDVVTTPSVPAQSLLESSECYSVTRSFGYRFHKQQISKNDKQLLRSFVRPASAVKLRTVCDGEVSRPNLKKSKPCESTTYTPVEIWHSITFSIVCFIRKDQGL
ncbi:hypothetical protein KC330_g48 [Hortaea werneckii]|nr:hypothetical protein KC330_g48 [Hortaea werneckii]